MAIRWLQGANASSVLPPVFKNSCEGLPAKIDEYILDFIMHDDEGALDLDLEDLTVRDLHVKGATFAAKRAFFGHLLANRFTAIDWESMLIEPLCRLLYPGATPRVWTMAELYLDPER